MAIELSNLTFTEQDDIVPASGVEEIVNTGIANTLAGDDIIIGTSTGFNGIYVISGNINTGDGNDTITGTASPSTSLESGINVNGFSRIDTEKGKDIITGNGYVGIRNSGLLNTGNEDDIITGNSITTENGNPYTIGIDNFGILNTGDGNDTISGTNSTKGSYGLANAGLIDTSNGNDIITVTAFFANHGTINTGNGKDSIIPHGGFLNSGGVFLGDGNDSIIASFNNNFNFFNRFDNFNTIDTGNGDDIITSTSLIFNHGTINIGKGEDSIISQARFSNVGNVFLGDGKDSIIATTDLSGADLRYGLENFNGIDTGDGDDIITTGVNNEGVFSDGVINMGNGKDSLIAEGGFKGNGNVFLGNDKDYLKGFGSGNFDGGNGKDTLKLTSGNYTVGISGTALNFTKDSIIMNTSGFEELIAGSTTYNFASLTAGQTIVVA